MTQEAYDEVINAPHKAKLSHELIAAAASYEAAKAWNQHKEKNGEEVSHGKMKQFLAAASGAFIDRMVETKGLDFVDKQKAKKQVQGEYYVEDDC
ncbi:CipC-like protein [Imleria badia]|nr:CipC-like protein [Imleria badia]